MTPTIAAKNKAREQMSNKRHYPQDVNIAYPNTENLMIYYFAVTEAGVNKIHLPKINNERKPFYKRLTRKINSLFSSILPSIPTTVPPYSEI